MLHKQRSSLPTHILMALRWYYGLNLGQSYTIAKRDGAWRFEEELAGRRCTSTLRVVGDWVEGRLFDQVARLCLWKIFCELCAPHLRREFRSLGVQSLRKLDLKHCGISPGMERSSKEGKQTGTIRLQRGEGDEAALEKTFFPLKLAFSYMYIYIYTCICVYICICVCIYVYNINIIY